MADDLMRYSELVDIALRGVVRQALRNVAEGGLQGDHHFYISCATQHPDLILPKYFMASHPEEITLVLQHQFWDLEVAEDAFDVTLSFNGKRERLHVPFAAILGFADPSVEFGLQFKVGTKEDPKTQDDEDQGEVAEDGSNSGEKVVQLDTFRRS